MLHCKRCQSFSLVYSGYCCGSSLCRPSASTRYILSCQQRNCAELGRYGPCVGSCLLQWTKGIISVHWVIIVAFSYDIGLWSVLPVGHLMSTNAVWLSSTWIWLTSFSCFIKVIGIILCISSLQIDPSECKILLTDPPLNPSKNREKMVSTTSQMPIPLFCTTMCFSNISWVILTQSIFMSQFVLTNWASCITDRDHVWEV